jgi:hypothetical protein
MVTHISILENIRLGISQSFLSAHLNAVQEVQ